MAVPTFVSITPSTGPTGGRTIVEIIGTNFNQHPDPPATGPGGPLLPAMQVDVGGFPATNVQVVSATRLFCQTPALPPGTHDVVLRNVDSNDDPIVGEEVTAVGAFTAERQSLNAQSQMTAVVRELIIQLRNQVIENVAYTTSVDYDNDGVAGVDLAELPSLILSGPTMVENRFFTENGRTFSDKAAGEFYELRETYTVDLQFDLLGATDASTQLMNMMVLATQYFHRNRYLSVPITPGVPADGTTDYEMELLRDFTTASTINNSDVRSFNGGFLIRGFEIGGLEDFTEDLARGVVPEITEICVDPEPVE